MVRKRSHALQPQNRFCPPAAALCLRRRQFAKRAFLARLLGRCMPSFMCALRAARAGAGHGQVGRAFLARVHRRNAQTGTDASRRMRRRRGRKTRDCDSTRRRPRTRTKRLVLGPVTCDCSEKVADRLRLFDTPTKKISSRYGMVSSLLLVLKNEQTTTPLDGRPCSPLLLEEDCSCHSSSSCTKSSYCLCVS